MNNNITQTDNFIVGYNNHKPIAADLTYVESDQKQPLIIFCHGYKGYKDWGAWHLAAKAFADAGFVFLKFNFSHNGGTFENPIDFPDLEAFGKDNYTKQMQDLHDVISFALNNNEIMPSIDQNNISLIGHSRGGGMACLVANESKHITKLVTWAGLSDYKSRFPKGEKLEQWKSDAVFYVKNGRTKQDMPHYIQFYKDFLDNEERFNIQKAVEKLKIPFLILHGEQDETVSPDEAKSLKQWCDHSKLNFIENATHTFNTKQPWENDELSLELKNTVELSIEFLKDKN